ncbi:transposase [Micromonospora luteifusca]|uniref:transposase n=1 Tax=Micromonospora luteifusca TaxID=709860 RepID=UPI0033A98180
MEALIITSLHRPESNLITDHVERLTGRPAGPPHDGQPITRPSSADRYPSEAAFARLCGAAPIPVSSGRTDRHRPHRGGDRDANSALWRVALARMLPPTHPRLRRPTHLRRQDQDRDHAMPQALHRPRDFCLPH